RPGGGNERGPGGFPSGATPSPAPSPRSASGRPCSASSGRSLDGLVLALEGDPVLGGEIVELREGRGVGALDEIVDLRQQGEDVRVHHRGVLRVVGVAGATELL